MKKRMIAILCMLVWLIGLIPLMTSAAADVCFIAINDELPALTVETLPIRVGGMLYLPCTVFDKRVTGVDLGVYYGWHAQGETITLYSQNRRLTFDVKAGTAYSDQEDKEYAYQAIVRNGMPYVPAGSSCWYFGLKCPLLITDDNRFQVLRISNGKQVLDDNMFIRSAIPILEEKAAKYNQNTNGNQGGGTAVKPGSSGDETQPDAQVYLAIRMGSGQNLSAIMNAMKSSRQVKGVFFFPVEQLAAYDDTLRELVMSGQRIGLIAKGTTLEEQLGSLQEGNRLLKHILRQKAVFVLNEGLSEEMQKGLQEEGYLPWKANITLGSRGRSDSALYQAVLDRIGDSKGKARVLLDDNTKGGTVFSILRQLREEQYDIRILRETDF